MALRFGSGTVANLRLGSSQVSKLMLGTTEVWAESSGPVASRSQTYDAKVVNNPNTNIYTISGLNIGPADANRRVVVAFGSRRGNVNLASVTIGGIAVTEIQTGLSGSGYNRIWMGVATVPTGTTADLVVTFSTSDSGRTVAAATAALVGYDLPVKDGGIDVTPALSIGGLDASGANTIAIAAQWCRQVSGAGTNIFTAGVTQQVSAYEPNQQSAIHLGAAVDVNNASLTVSANTYGNDAMLVACTLGAS